MTSVLTSVWFRSKEEQLVLALYQPQMKQQAAAYPTQIQSWHLPRWTAYSTVWIDRQMKSVKVISKHCSNHWKSEYSPLEEKELLQIYPKVILVTIWMQLHVCLWNENWVGYGDLVSHADCIYRACWVFKYLITKQLVIYTEDNKTPLEISISLPLKANEVIMNSVTTQLTD